MPSHECDTIGSGSPIPPHAIRQPCSAETICILPSAPVCWAWCSSSGWICAPAQLTLQPVGGCSTQQSYICEFPGEPEIWNNEFGISRNVLYPGFPQVRGKFLFVTLPELQFSAHMLQAEDTQKSVKRQKGLSSE